MCKVLKVSRSSYYRWYSSGPSKRAIENSIYSDLIKQLFEESNQTYGSPRITAALRRNGYVISERRV